MVERQEYSEMSAQERNAEFSRFFDFVYLADQPTRVSTGMTNADFFREVFRSRINLELPKALSARIEPLLSCSAVTDPFKVIIKGYIRAGSAGLRAPIDFKVFFGVEDDKGGIFDSERCEKFELATFKVVEGMNAILMSSETELSATYGVKLLGEWRGEFVERYGHEPHSL